MIIRFFSIDLRRRMNVSNFWDLPRNCRPYKQAVSCLVSKQELVSMAEAF